MARKIRSITITPKKSGGHQVVHEFEPEAGSSGGLGGGLSLKSPAAKTHNFAPNDGHNLLKNIAGALAIQGLSNAQQPTDLPQRRKQPQQTDQM